MTDYRLSSSLYHQSVRMRAIERRLGELRLQAYAPRSSALNGMPHAPGGGESAVERAALDICHLEAERDALRLEQLRERVIVERFIAGIPDSRTRVLFTMRYVGLLSWDAIALKIAGETADSVKKYCSRCIRAMVADGTIEHYTPKS